MHTITRAQDVRCLIPHLPVWINVKCQLRGGGVEGEGNIAKRQYDRARADSEKKQQKTANWKQ